MGRIRLLNVKTLECQSFSHYMIPNYAIASHKWIITDGCPEEILYGQLERHSKYAGVGASSLGYRKVKGFCASVRAISPELEWLWIDSCCINKSDPAELSYSINSMFSFYADAKVCIVHLSDVDRCGSNLSSSIWFTRGWTLQELLAPGCMVFFSQEWNIIGYKCNTSKCRSYNHPGSDLSLEISSITGIDRNVLCGSRALRSVPLDEKLEWSRGRETTVPEDKYYCLQGILDIHVQPAYGIGQARAWQLFQIAIRDFAQISANDPLPTDWPSHLLPDSDPSSMETLTRGHRNRRRDLGRSPDPDLINSAARVPAYSYDAIEIPGAMSSTTFNAMSDIDSRYTNSQYSQVGPASDPRTTGSLNPQPGTSRYSRAVSSDASEVIGASYPGSGSARFPQVEVTAGSRQSDSRNSYEGSRCRDQASGEYYRIIERDGYLYQVFDSGRIGAKALAD